MLIYSLFPAAGTAISVTLPSGEKFDGVAGVTTPMNVQSVLDFCSWARHLHILPFQCAPDFAVYQGQVCGCKGKLLQLVPFAGGRFDFWLTVAMRVVA